MSTAESQPDSASEGKESSNTAPTTEAQQNTYAGMATSAAGSAAETATNAAVGVKDTMFSMFGGGGKKEVNDEKAAEGEEDRSGSAKAAKEKQKEKETKGEVGHEEEGVSHHTLWLLVKTACVTQAHNATYDPKSCLYRGN